jgi:mono/diheme cytochrome c family protein
MRIWRQCSNKLLATMGFVWLLSLTSQLHAQTLPSPQQLSKQLGNGQAVRVIEPHMSSTKLAVNIVYLGYPIEKVLSSLQLKPALTQHKHANQLARYYIEFVCQDGYISRIPAEKFLQYQAYLVTAKQDGSDFKVNVHEQHQQDIVLGPYYLVWDNLTSKALQQLGSYHWPYQVIAINIKPYQGNIAQAKLANDYCLTCHQLNGDGGKVLAINLAQIGKQFSQQQFIDFILNPSRNKPNSPMPALNPRLTEAQRQQIATSLYQFFNSIPVSSSD